MYLFGRSVLIFVLFKLYNIINAAKILECPLYSTYFQKVIGYRPASVSLSSSSLIYKGIQRYSPPKAINDYCYKICQQDKYCFSYVVYFNVSECYGFTKNSQFSNYEVLKEDSVLVADNNAIYFEKFCMPGLCSNTLWPVIRMPGRKIIGKKYKNISHLVNRAQCIKYCLDEYEFKCRSVSFIASYKNNRNRINGAHLVSSNNLGQCVLNEDDKNSRPEALELTFPDHEYIEVSCSSNDDYCFFERKDNVYVAYADLEYGNVGPFECESKCVSNKNFTCLGYSMVNNVCLIHSEKPFSLGNQVLVSVTGAYYMERMKCLNVSVICSNNEMTVTYFPKEVFYGKLSVLDHSYSNICNAVGIGDGPITLNLPIGNEIKESLCGVNRAYHIGPFGNRTLLQTKVIIQNDPPIPYDFDKVIRVGCIVNNYHDDYYQADLSSQFQYNDSFNMPLPSISLKMLNSITLEEVNHVSLGDIIQLKVTMFPADVYDMHARNLFARSLDGRQNIQLLDYRGCPTDTAIFPSIEKEQTKNFLILHAKFSAFKFIDSPIINFDITINFCEFKCPTIVCDLDNIAISHGRRRRDIDTNITSSEEVTASKDIPSWEPLKLSSNTSEDAPIQKNEAPVNESVEVNADLRQNFNFVESPRHHQKVFTQYTFIDGSLQDDAFYLTKILQSNSEIKLHFQMFVGDPKRDTVIVDSYNVNNSRIFVALSDADNVVKLDSSLLAAILIFWFIVNVIIIFICYWLVKRYKNQPEIYYSSSTLDRFHHISQFDSLDRRGRVHWSVPYKSNESLHI